MKFKSLIIASAIALTGVTVASANSTDPIKIPLNEWTGQHISARLLGATFEKAGLKVEYVTAGAVPQFAAIGQGDLHVQPETWENNVGDIYPKAVAKGDIVPYGELGITAREGWIYPPYMAEKCPGLPDANALYKCAQAFATAETFPKGRLITYPADWGTRSKDLVASSKLPFAAVAGGSEGAMVAEIKSAVAAKQPILVMFWEPHWLFTEVAMDWVKWPELNSACDSDPAHGISPDVTGDCGFHQAGVLKIAWKGFADKWPDAAKILKKFSVDNTIQNGLIKEIDNKGRDTEEVIAEWMANNEATWKSWM